MHTTKPCIRRLFLSLLLCPVFFGALAFDKELSGRITDNEGRPLEGVSVMVKNSRTGTTTDAAGHFRLSVPDNATTLVLSILGYSGKEVSIRGRSVIDISLESTASALGDVVVVGYGSQKRSDVTGAVSSVKGSDLTRLPTQRIDQALQGRASGVAVQNTDGSPGGNTTIRIRGGNSIIGSNNALVVVDGIQGVNINTLNPNDVESLEVLKDASATAIYGSRGANGVILITTKRGASGAPKVNYGYSLGTQKLIRKLPLLSAGDYARKSNDWAAAQTGTVSAPVTPIIPFTDDQIAALDNSGGTDWQDVIYRSAGTQNHQLSINGGSENARYFVSAGYLNQHGIVVGTNYERYNLRSNLDLKVNKWFNAGINVNVIKDKGNIPPVGEGTYYGDILGQVVNAVPRFDPITPVYDSTGAYNFRALKAGPAGNKGYGDPDVWNPLATALETKSENNNNINEISTFLEFKILDGLTLRVTGAATVTNNDAKHYYNTLTLPGRGVNGMGDLSTNKTEYYQNSNILTYNKTFNEKHHLVIVGAAEQQLIQNKGIYINAQDFFNDITGINDISGANLINQKTSTSTKQTLNSFLGRVNYTYDGKYMVTASWRADGSSVFGANHKWGYFPSAAVAWRVSEEEFMKAMNLFSTLKVRASWGKTGNQAISPYQSLATLISGQNNYPYYGNGPANIGFVLALPGNPDLRWETTAQTNFGVDLGFYEDRLTATIDVYNKKTTDLLLNKQVENYTGFSTVLANVGSIQNRGLEIAVGAKPLVGSGLKWNTNVNISFNRNKVLALQNDLALPIRTNTGGGYNIYKDGAYSLKYLQKGQSIDQMHGYVNLGTWKTSEADQAKAYGQVPGEAKWKDANKDGDINLQGDGNEIIGNATPKFIYGWNNDFSYKNFELSFLIQGSYGNDIFNAVRSKLESPAYGTGANLKDRWTTDHQNTNVPAFISTRDRSALNLGTDHTATIADSRSNRWVEDGSYLRMKNVTLTYSLPAPLISRIHFSRVSFYATAINLFTITKYTGYDPEVSSFNVGGAGGLGVDLSNYPTSRIFLVGVNLGF